MSYKSISILCSALLLTATSALAQQFTDDAGTVPPPPGPYGANAAMQQPAMAPEMAGMMPQMGAGPVGQAMTNRPFGGARGRSGMGGTGMVPGPDALSSIWALELTDDQRNQVRSIMDQLRNLQAQHMGEMMGAMSTLQGLYGAGRWDGDAIDKAYRKVFELRLQGISNLVAARNQAFDLLTDTQREQLAAMENDGRPARNMGYRRQQMMPPGQMPPQMPTQMPPQ